MPPSSAEALVVKTDGSAASTLEGRSIPVPSPGEHQVLVRISHVAQNPTDVQSLDTKAFDDGAVLGCDFVGTVEQLGPGVSSFSQGDTIAGLIWGGEIPGQGGYSQYALADSRIAFPVPDTIRPEEAATVPLAALTAVLALFSEDSLAIDKGTEVRESVLIWGGSSSVGLFAIQIAAMYGLDVVTTCSPAHHDLVRSLGASHVFDYHDEQVVDKIRSAAPELRYVFDNIGNETSSATASKAIAQGGGALCTVRPGKDFTEDVADGVKVTDVLVWTAFLKEHKYRDSVYPISKADHTLAADFCAKLPQLLTDGTIKPNKVKVFSNEKFHDGGETLELKDKSLYATALHFRISRQLGYHIPQDVLKELKNEVENLDSICGEKAKGMLSLYEASFLAMEGESFLDEARHIAIQYLSEYLKSTNNDQIICTMITHALELPFHWRMPRLEARWFIDVYQKIPDANSVLLELAKLDFNIVQSTHQDDLKYVSRWWKSTGLGEKLEFARDRLMANFFWSVGMGCEPNLAYLRTMSTKIASLITIIDDVYDVYGTLDELELFTDAVERWDIAAIDSLPNYMQICFIALHNTINDMTLDAIKDHGVNVIPYLRKMWTDLCKTFLIEAKWYYSNYKPTFQEYLENAWISVSGSLLLVHAYVFATNSITKEALECLQDYPLIIRHSSIIFRLANDLASSSEEAKRGEVAKSIQCYMNDTGASEEEARQYIKDLIMESWKKMNEVQILNSSPLFSKGFIEIVLNLARISHTVYQHRDGHTVEDHETKDRVLSLFIKPA